jgi:hypothetical protein
MPLPGLPPSKGTVKWEVSTEIGGRDCAWRTQGQGIEVDEAHTDYNGLSTAYPQTFFSIDFADSEITNGGNSFTPTSAPSIVAPADSILTAVGTDQTSPGGLFVHLKFGPNYNYEIHLLHLASINQIILKTKLGSIIKQGQVLGVMGHTGSESFGTHLHVTFIYKGNGSSTVEQLTKLRMEGLILRQYQTDCNIDDSTQSARTKYSYYLSTNGN